MPPPSPATRATWSTRPASARTSSVSGAHPTEGRGLRATRAGDDAARLDELDTDQIPPTASVLPLHNVLRADECRASWPRDEMLANNDQVSWYPPEVGEKRFAEIERWRREQDAAADRGETPGQS